MTSLARPFWIPPASPPETFPPARLALDNPNGLLAVGGDLTARRLIYAYRHGIFPWFSDDQPILWWSPDPRAVITPDSLKVSRSLRKSVRKAAFRITVNRAFEAVVRACAGPRASGEGTWITGQMVAAYVNLHHMDIALSIECWDDAGRLAGGLYGLSMGQLFCGESMFSHKSDASKIALFHLCQLGYALIDCQVPNAHLESLGAHCIPRSEFLDLLPALIDKPREVGA